MEQISMIAFVPHKIMIRIAAPIHIYHRNVDVG